MYQHKPDEVIKERLENLKQVFRQTQGDLYDLNEQNTANLKSQFKHLSQEE